MLRLGQKVRAGSSVLLYMVSQNCQIFTCEFLQIPEIFHRLHATLFRNFPYQVANISQYLNFNLNFVNLIKNEK